MQFAQVFHLFLQRVSKVQLRELLAQVQKQNESALCEPSVTLVFGSGIAVFFLEKHFAQNPSCGLSFSHWAESPHFWT